MKAIVIVEDGNLELQEVPTPTLREGEALIRVHAAGVNRADLLQAAGHYPPLPGESEILGLECAGVVEDPGTTDFQKGDRVAALLAGGGYAEFVAVPTGQLMPIPEGYSFHEAAAVIEVATTVWSNIGMLTGLEPGHTLLIHGGAGGIGTFAIQLAKHIGATVAVTAGSQEKLDRCAQLGADILINYREQDFSEVLKDRCDRILDIMGAKYLDQNVRALADGGHQVTIGMQGGVKGELNIGRLLAKRGTISATALRSRSKEDKARIVQSTIENVWPLLESGAITHQIHATYPLAEAAKAHQVLKAGEVTGKLVLEVAPG
ncbi:NAD(P)H-quinone oxidoreductase [Corynebacterium sp. 153RC1]|uniref:NAD(P)H-quinone oxidoreductase n=1 Tax=unclassified Corynebacterium TaxID=2624378 RepID=UPI00211CE803|nr:MULTISPECIES: NAD(P)H-quinone oxidoreductase [unclassified Corynebacterium]MCQ9352853.1 NAD(P)H-quinone oxidoreductase [Corynebacterium sp. 209RC1]MCQ9355245.1 NAD(P)H-quinone oxidoreductase [Corynebacterium sp. 1222RC1]MCQ9357432.1 NAD(P)H-quinone oxidoreductase [Corynebacterium sp. 122RC1]MCQ9359640.1 NAD(P)H-quinone oxidoreductase [Corynebacterium sp. 142RC1]MCQ9361654.1 NAD(P)H-quinone oxidoreductase [Corynebacterium sp. 153RC1]